MIRILFGIIASLGLLTALGTVLARNLVHAALFLVAFFFLIACQFVLLEAEFMAAMQVLVYIGAVSILLIFGIMLTRNIQGDETTSGHWVWKVPAAVAGLAVLGVLVYGISEQVTPPGGTTWADTTSRPPTLPEQVSALPAEDRPAAATRARAIENMGKAVGDEMMTRYALPFEVAGLLLTAALVGAIALAHGEDRDETPRRGAIATARTSTTYGPATTNPTTTTGLPR